MHVLFVTTVDASYRSLFTTWLALLLYSLSNSPVLQGDLQYSLAVGCMPSAHKINDGRRADRLVSLPAGLNCTHVNDIPGFEFDGRKHHQKFFVSYPDVRRTMMMRAFASTGLYDVIVYSDLDAFIVRSPVPDLMQYWTEKYTAVYSREHYNTSIICNGFYALMDMSLPNHWISRGVYSQNEVNNWLNPDPAQFYSTINVKRAEGGFYKIGLLPEPQYYRGGCGGDPVSPDRKVEHCHSKFFNGKEKLNTFLRLNRSLGTGEEVDQERVTQVLAAAIGPSIQGINVSDFVYFMRDRQRKSRGNEYNMTLHPHRLTITAGLSAGISRLPRWKDVQQAYKLF